MLTEILLNESEAWLVRSKEMVTLKPLRKQVVRSTLDGSFPTDLVCVCVEPAQIPTEGICAAPVFTRISTVGTAEQLTDIKVSVIPSQNSSLT